MEVDRALRTQHLPTRLGSIAVHISGEGPSVLLWPSIFMPHIMWRGQIAVLARDYRVIAIDPPGHGESGPVAANFTLDECAGVVVDILDGMGIDKATLCGNSWGGMVAIAFASLYPKRCDAIAIMNSSARPASLAHRVQFGPLVPILRNFGFLPPLPAISIRSFLGPIARKTQPQLVQWVAHQLKILDPASAAHVAASILLNRADQRGRLTTINVPTLVLGGIDDAIMPPEHSQELARNIPAASLVMLDHTGHFAPMESPDRVNEALRAFLLSARIVPTKKAASD